MWQEGKKKKIKEIKLSDPRAHSYMHSFTFTEIMVWSFPFHFTLASTNGSSTTAISNRNAHVVFLRMS